MIEWSLDAFAACEVLAAAVVAVPPGLAEGTSGDASSRPPDVRQVGPGDGSTSPAEVLAREGLTVVEGGATRAQSVSNALAEVQTELVAIHDAARPLVTPALIEALVADLDASPEAAAVIAAAPVTDTVKRAPARSTRQLASYGNAKCLVVEETVDRRTLWAAQTPQVFRTDVLREALAVEEGVRNAATDEAMLVEAAGGIVLLHEVTEPNLKVTTPHDLRVAELLLAERA